VLTVGPQGSDATYTSIQAALDAAPAGAVITVRPGTYEENLTIRRPVTLQGAGWQQTTIRAPAVSPEQVKRDLLALQETLALATTAEQRQALQAAFREKFLAPAVHVVGARDIELRDLKLCGPALLASEQQPQSSILRISRSQVRIEACALLRSPGDGIEILDGSDVAVRATLVAGLWETGISIGSRDTAPTQVRIDECDIRNCRYAGICIAPRQDVVIERCRISGAAWHGIRYDDASPTITDNCIFGNARCGIYASGKTAATVQGNLLLRNEMSGIACWFNNQDTIAQNTFVANAGEGLDVLGASAPTVQRNIFTDHPTAILLAQISDPSPAAKVFGSPRLEGNLFWKNTAAYQRRQPVSSGTTQPTMEDVPLAPETRTLSVDPQFVNASGDDFSLAPASLARQHQIGATATPAITASPWPSQPEEKAIIPDGPGRDYRLWKRSS
jgi:hypothetical protein